MSEAQVAAARRDRIEAGEYRRVLGNFPTGVVAVTALQDDGSPAGMTIGSFTSVSLDPPLVAFLPDKGSSSFPKIRAAGSFCVNVLSANQEHVCRSFAVKGGDKFAGISWRPATSGAPVLDGVVAWIDCDIEQIHEAGDHYLVLGRVRDLAAADGAALPLLFLQGGYGEFFSPWKTAPATADLLPLMTAVDSAREEMTGLARELSVECLLSAQVGGEMVILASAGKPARRLVNTIGQRIPLLPPIGIPLVAWAGNGAVEAWLARVDPATPQADVSAVREMVERVRARGWSMALAGPEQIALEGAVAHLSVPEPPEEQRALLRARIEKLLAADCYEPESVKPEQEYRIRHLSAPVLDTAVPLALSLYGLPSAVSGARIADYVEPLRAAGERIGARIGHKS